MQILVYDIILQVFFFNLTNHEALLAGREVPRVDKIGPYTYTQIIHKVSTPTPVRLMYCGFRVQTRSPEPF